jgi:hypothetical protein
MINIVPEWDYEANEITAERRGFSDFPQVKASGSSPLFENALLRSCILDLSFSKFNAPANCSIYNNEISNNEISNAADNQNKWDFIVN